MELDLDPRFVMLLPVAIFMMIAVGIPLSEARNEAALPLVGECFSVGSYLLFGGNTFAFSESLILCSMGTIILISVPGAVGIGKIVLK